VVMTSYIFFLCLLPASRWFLAWLIYWPWRWRWYVSPKPRLTFNRLRGVKSRKVVLFDFAFALQSTDPFTWGWKHPGSETLCSLVVFRVPESGQSPKTQ
jgi:hypothetical protein